MKLLRKVAAAGAVFAVVIAPFAYAAGMWPNLPMVGQAAFCAAIIGSGPTQLGNTGQGAGTTSTGAPSTFCAQTVPAGPPVMTGSEVFPADTEIANSGPPQTVTIPAALAASGAYQYATNAGLALVNLAINNNVNTVIMDATGALTNLTLTLPAAPLDGQVVRFSSDQNLTALVVLTTGLAGAGVKNSPQSLTTSTSGDFGYSFMYKGGTVNTWFRLQ